MINLQHDLQTNFEAARTFGVAAFLKRSRLVADQQNSYRVQRQYPTRLITHTTVASRAMARNVNVMSRYNHWTSRFTLSAMALLTFAIPTSQAQQFGGPGGAYHQPFSQHTPPGQLAGLFNHNRQYDPAWRQPLEVDVAGGGDVEIYQGTASINAGQSPAVVACGVGHLYRLKISNLPGLPGLEVFPTVELLDRLHPPTGREVEFAIPILITEADIRRATAGNLVTRVIYLEQPQLAQQIDPLRREVPQAVLPTTNALQEADRLGRAMAIIRIGGRRISPSAPPMFFGTGGPVELPEPSVAPQAISTTSHVPGQSSVHQVSAVGVATVSQFAHSSPRIAGCQHCSGQMGGGQMGGGTSGGCQACSSGGSQFGAPIQPNLSGMGYPVPPSQAYHDEYIFDGGDRAYPIHYPGGYREGLDTEDTIAEFEDHTGESHYRPSNRVAVYAPRFGAIETVTGPGIDIKVDKAAGAREVRGIDALHERKSLEANIANTPATGLRTREGASGVEMSQNAFQNYKAQPVVQTTKIDQGFLNTRALGPNLLAMTDLFETSVRIAGPVSANQGTLLGQAQSTVQATQTYAMFKVQSVLGTDKSSRKGDLKITKRASAAVAKSGDTITFTLLFRNIGDRPISSVRIIDNLTPRLVYIDGTAQVDIPGGAAGNLSVLPNKEGSQILEFTLDEPLKGQTTGKITFDTQVR